MSNEEIAAAAPETPDAIADKAIEFQPDALEIKHERLPWWARLGVWSGLIFMVGAIIWATVFKVDMIVTAEGKLVTDTPTIIMKPLERTVIKSIEVKVGDRVEKDQILFLFDPVASVAEAERLRAELSTLDAQFERLLAEFKFLEYVPNDPLNEDQQFQKAIFDQRRQFFEQRINSYDEQILQVQASKRAYEESYKNAQGRLEKLLIMEKMYDRLYESNAISQAQMLETQIKTMELADAVDSYRNKIVEVNHQEQTAVATKNSYIEEWRNTLSTELVKIQRELISTRKSYDKIEAQLNYNALRAPIDAIVHEVAPFPVGSAVREAEALITLIPLNSRIELEAEILPQDIGKVQIGDPVRVKLNPFPFQKHGTLDGVVRDLSEDSIQKQQGDPGRARTYYRARIELTGELRNIKDNFRMIPGMESQAEIIVGRRRIIEYVLHPLIKSLDEAIREP